MYILRVFLCFMALICMGCMSNVKHNSTNNNSDSKHIPQQPRLVLEDRNLEAHLEADRFYFTSNGSKLVAGGTSGVTLYDLVSHVDMVFPGRNISFATSADSNTLAIGFPIGLQLLDTKSGKQINAFKSDIVPRAMALSPRGDMLALSDGKQLRLVALPSGKIDLSSPMRGALIFGDTVFGFSPDGRYFAFCAPKAGMPNHNVVTFLDLTARRILHEIEIVGTIRLIRFSPNSERLVVVTNDPATVDNVGRLHCIDISSGKSLLSWKTNEAITDVEFSPDSNRLAVGTYVYVAALGSAGALHLIDASDGKVEGTIGFDNVVFDVDFSPDGQMLAAASGHYSLWNKRGVVSVLDSNNFNELYALNNPSPMDSVSFSADGNFLAVGGCKTSIRGGSKTPIRLLFFKKQPSSTSSAQSDGLKTASQ